MTNSRIKALRGGHDAIIEVISQIEPSLRFYNKIKPLLRELNALVLSHFTRQNDILYKRLEEYYAQDRPSLKILEFLVFDLKELKVNYLYFFDKHTGEMGDRETLGFPVEFMNFSRQILGRIKMEEEYLFPLIDRLEN